MTYQQAGPALPTGANCHELLTDALAILKAIRRFWTSIEKDIGTFDDHGDVYLDEVTSLSLVVLQMCIDAYVAGLPAPE